MTGPNPEIIVHTPSKRMQVQAEPLQAIDSCKRLKRPNEVDPEDCNNNRLPQRSSTTVTGSSTNNNPKPKSGLLAKTDTIPPATSTTNDNRNENTHLFSGVPLADWQSIQEIIDLIRRKQFRQLCNATNYPYQADKDGRGRGNMMYTVGQPMRSRETLVPGTRCVRTTTNYHYYDTTTGQEISSDEYQVRYEQAMTKLDWSVYFSQLRMQKSLQKAAGTVAIQIQQLRKVYAAKLAEMDCGGHRYRYQYDQQENGELYDSLSSGESVEEEHPYDEMEVGKPWFEAYV